VDHLEKEKENIIGKDDALYIVMSSCTYIAALRPRRSTSRILMLGGDVDSHNIYFSDSDEEKV
jgi:hypothetical protein